MIHKIMTHNASSYSGTTTASFLCSRPFHEISSTEPKPSINLDFAMPHFEVQNSPSTNWSLGFSLVRPKLDWQRNGTLFSVATMHACSFANSIEFSSMPIGMNGLRVHTRRCRRRADALSSPIWNWFLLFSKSSCCWEGLKCVVVVSASEAPTSFEKVWWQLKTAEEAFEKACFERDPLLRLGQEGITRWWWWISSFLRHHEMLTYMWTYRIDTYRFPTCCLAHPITRHDTNACIVCGYIWCMQ